MINRTFPGYHWIYWVGPLLGSLLASGFYHLLCWVRWENINPGQDYDDRETKARKDSVLSESTMADHVHGSQGQTYQPPNGAQTYRDTSHGALVDQAANTANQAAQRADIRPENQV